MVAALNQHPGVGTVGSCDGHWGLLGAGAQPYVYFLAPLDKAVAMLRGLGAIQDSLRWRWTLEILEHPVLGPAFLLSATRPLHSMRLPCSDVEQVALALNQALMTQTEGSGVDAAPCQRPLSPSGLSSASQPFPSPNAVAN